MNKDEQCTNLFIPCTNKNVQKKSSSSWYIHVYTRKYCFSIHFHVHTCLERVHAIYIQGTYIKRTNSYDYAQILEGKELPTLGIDDEVAMAALSHSFSIHLLFYLEVDDIRLAPDQLPPPAGLLTFRCRA